MSDAYTRLTHFIDMTMQHIYQPVMLEVLLTHGGSASVRDVAAAILPHDESQLDYYEQIVKRMPGAVLAGHGIVERQGNKYTLAPDFAHLTEDERGDLVSRCRKAVARFKVKRGAALWEHRALGVGVIPGRVRYETLARATRGVARCRQRLLP